MALKIGQREGAGLSVGHTNKRQASDKDLFGAIRDELSAVQAAGTVAQADASAPGGSYVQAEAATTADLANANKAALNAMAAVVKLFVK